MIRAARSFRISLSVAVAGSALHAAILVGPVAVFGGIGEFRFGAAPLLLCGLIAGWSLAESFCSQFRNAGGGETSRPAAHNHVMGFVLLLIHWVSVRECFRSADPAASILIAGASLMIGGIALRLAAIRRLGGRFLDDVALLPGHTYETGGPYRWLRHPSEAGTLLLAVGGAMIAHSPAAMLLVAACLLPCVLIRVRREDALLAKRFGDVFRDHAGRVPALVPALRIRSHTV